LSKFFVNLSKRHSGKRGRQRGSGTIKGRGAAGSLPDVWLALDIDRLFMLTTFCWKTGCWNATGLVPNFHKEEKNICEGKPR